MESVSIVIFHLQSSLLSIISFAMETYDARVKKGRKAESMGTTTAEPLAVLEKKIKRTEDDVLSTESEASPLKATAATPYPSNWATFTKSQKSHWRKRNK